MPRRSTPRSKTTGVPTPSQPQRLQRLLASAGFGSRRLCEELIEAGRVEVDGQVVTKLGTTVDPEVHKVRVDGVPLKKQKLVYYAVNKPVGVVTTNSDPHGRPRVVDLVPKSERVFAVGRLDRSSEGLILLTNDGDLAQRLTHPKFGVRKVYRVTVAGRVDGETMKRMRQGIFIAEGRVSVDGAKIVKARSKATEMEIILREGKNREIRRILARLGHKVLQLRRIAVGPLRLGDMPPGAHRIVGRDEVRKLQRATEPSAETDSSERRPKRGGAASGGATRGAGPRSGRKTVATQGGRPSPKTTGRPSSQTAGKPSSKTAGKPGRKTGGKPQRQAGKKSNAAIGIAASTGSSSAGVVIGADPAPAETKTRRKTSTKRKTTSTRSARSTGGRRATKRGAKGIANRGATRKPSSGGKTVSAKGGRQAGGVKQGGRGRTSSQKPVARKRKRSN